MKRIFKLFRKNLDKSPEKFAESGDIEPLNTEPNGSNDSKTSPEQTEVIENVTLDEMEDLLCSETDGNYDFDNDSFEYNEKNSDDEISSISCSETDGKDDTNSNDPSNLSKFDNSAGFTGLFEKQTISLKDITSGTPVSIKQISNIKPLQPLNDSIVFSALQDLKRKQQLKKLSTKSNNQTITTSTSTQLYK